MLACHSRGSVAVSAPLSQLVVVGWLPCGSPRRNPLFPLLHYMNNCRMDGLRQQLVPSSHEMQVVSMIQFHAQFPVCQAEILRWLDVLKLISLFAGSLDDGIHLYNLCTAVRLGINVSREQAEDEDECIWP